MKKVDPKALKILMAYDPTHPDGTSPDDFAYAKEQGLMFDPCHMDHDALVAWAINEFSVSRKQDIVRSFFIGIGLNEPYLRAAVSAYAVMVNFPCHNYTVAEQNPWNCAICGIMKDVKVDYSFLNLCRWTGSLVGRDPHVLAFYLEQNNRNPIDQTQSTLNAEKEGVHRFLEILELIANSPKDEKPSTLYKKIRKIPKFKISSEQARYFLDALGYCGIMQTHEHRGFIYEYTGYLNPSKSRSSDWGYPVDFWTGADGINLDAVKYWFSDYPEIVNWKPVRA